MTVKRETFGSQLAAVAAMASSAIGLGNIWRFPYMAGQYGGAAFIIIYILCSFFLALPIMLSEMVIGRSAHLGTFGAMEKLAPGTKWKWMGLLTVVTPLIIASFYSVVGGWSIGYLWKSLTLCFSASSLEDSTLVFATFSSSVWGPLICFVLFLAINCIIVLAGVRKGIEKFSNFTMYFLFALIVVIMLYSLSLDGSKAGVDYLVKPDFHKLTPKVFSSAMGQSFFSLSLGVGTILTYSSYAHDEGKLVSIAAGTAGFDLIFAVIAGFAIMPAVFAAGISPGQGPGLIFSTLPYIFAKMGLTSPWISALVSILFFLMILVAAVSSCISMIEVGVAYLIEQHGFTRRGAVLLLFFGMLGLGALCSLSFGPLAEVHIFGVSIFSFCDMLTSNYLMTFGGLLFVIFAGWKMDKEEVRRQLTNGASGTFASRIFGFEYFLIRYVSPLVIFAIFLTNLAS